MLCPKCKNEVSDFDTKCTVCETEIFNSKEESKDKTILLRIINAIQIISCMILAFVFLIQENIVLAIAILFGGFITFAFIKGFSDIIELLDKINNKLNK